MNNFKSGFVGIFGKPNAGKSTLLNALLGEKLSIVSHKAQTTRNKILGFLSEKNYQLIFADTPGIMDVKYKLHQRMMNEIIDAKQGIDVLLYLITPKENWEDHIELIKKIKTNAPIILVINKIDTSTNEQIAMLQQQIATHDSSIEIVEISALNKIGLPNLLEKLLEKIPFSPPYFDTDSLSDRPVRFFVSEIIREKLFHLLDAELPYHTAVLIRSFEEKNTLTKIEADIIVSRETQKGILLGQHGSMIKKIGQEARMDIEKFIDRKVFLALHVKVRKDWRDNDLFLKEYGY
ncbi:MAG: GTPase Era [Chitinophagaceae bacterium]